MEIVVIVGVVADVAPLVVILVDAADVDVWLLMWVLLLMLLLPSFCNCCGECCFVSADLVALVLGMCCRSSLFCLFLFLFALWGLLLLQLLL